MTGGYDCSISIFECINNVQKLKLQVSAHDVTCDMEMEYLAMYSCFTCVLISNAFVPYMSIDNSMCS